MRSGQVIGATLLILALGAADDAEARGRGVRLGARSARVGTIAVVTTGAIGTAAAQPGSGPQDPGLRPVLPVTAPAVREVRAAEPWCASSRVVGTGAGFCLIN